MDIETIPGPIPPVLDLDNIKVPKTHKKPEAIKEYIESKRAELEAGKDDEWAKQALHLAQAQIVCIGWAVNDGPVKTVVAPPPTPADNPRIDERAVLTAFVRDLQAMGRFEDPKIIWVGHNFASFDAPRLLLRAWKYGLYWLPEHLHADRYKSNIDDTMEMARGGAWKDFVKLDDLAAFFGLPVKTSHGSEVWGMWKEGRRQELADYCAHDVALTRAVHNRLKPVSPRVRQMLEPEHTPEAEEVL
ncbi:hypothetical protein DGI_2003 [Megalodesulfovibrio gigas DSM 1382 = ATCC 19364]|uniref:Predicted 3'-5' exonuclease PolB-like domain-containing protein n=1 Tax=Megalodesulfovibrio gigas (strain ATCC 19364 / DSM 1382 / NCIMB 9332 / VKM B-1759) TaxID=1121448 RepID=T2GCZ0_MEGG1|nr:hypothetical protein DGI_2003 [Megalodesulfovibrio gigas DSM 1382 = ATCC 19364]